MDIKIALAGNPNSGKTTLFNALTGANQFVGNWPGVTVEKKEGKLKKHSDVSIIDLPGIYSLSPYSLEEVVARNYLINEAPDAILNIIDGTNLERNLYLTTQLTELGIPVVVAVNMMDVVKKNEDKIDTEQLSKQLGCKVIEISALKGDGVMEAAEAAIEASKGEKTVPQHKFADSVESAITNIKQTATANMPEEKQRWYAVKLFERDDKVMEQLNLSQDVLAKVEESVKAVETELDDDSESIITNERYVYISSIIKDCYTKKNKTNLTTSDKIDRVVTNRWLALPIFAVVMFIVYYVSVTTVGTIFTDWANDGVFGDGWLLLGIGRDELDEATEEYDDAQSSIGAYESVENANLVIAAYENGDATVELPSEDEDAEEGATEEVEVTEELYEEYLAVLEESVNEDGTVVWKKYADEEFEDTGLFYEYIEVTEADYEAAQEVEEPNPSDYGVWIPGIPVLIEDGLNAINCVDWLQSLILDGIVAGVGAVLGFVPQMLVLFLFLAFLEGCGYMARIAFIMDRIFRRFGLSGKSFIPMLIGTGCGVPGIMASRTIENERDRRMTIMTTTFIPCGAKLPIIALIAGAIFNNAGWVAASAYFVGVAAIIVSGIILKKTKMFSGDPAPFVMELPSYHLPTVGSVLRSMWERGWSFIKKAGTIILLSTIFVWFTSNYGFIDGSFGPVDELADASILGIIGNAIAWIFQPLGWGDWRAAVAAVTGLVAKENVVGTFGILYGSDVATEGGSEIWETVKANFSAISAYSFLVFNLLCAPCFAAMGAIKREMNSGKWTAFAIGYQCVFAYVISLIIYQTGTLVTYIANGGTTDLSIVGIVAAAILLIGLLILLFRPYKESNRLEKNVKINA